MVLRFGLQLPSFTFPGVPDDGLFNHVVEIAGAAEAAGFDSLFVMDHFQQIGLLGPPEEPMLEAYTLLGAIAARTSRAKLGTLVTGVAYRNPALLAKIVTTLDIVSAGRAILGIGAAWNEREAREYGYDWPSAGERMERLEDALRICRAMFTEGRATVDGARHQVQDALNFPRPIQPGGPKILVGGSGERRTLRLVAQYADACNLFGDVETVRHKLGVLEDHCREVGRDPAEITKTRYTTLVVAPTKGEAQARFERLPGTSELPDEHRSHYMVGDAGDVCDQAQPYFDAGLDGLVFGAPLPTLEDMALVGGALVERFGAR